MLLLLNTTLIQPWHNTRYAPGYSARAFYSVAYGDSEQRVLELLGEPLERNPASQNPAYIYLRYSKAIGPSETHLSRIILLIYAAKAHPQLEGSELVLTYATNIVGYGRLVARNDLYYPRFLRASFKATTDKSSP
jgi:hypothetical protein